MITILDLWENLSFYIVPGSKNSIAVRINVKQIYE